MFTTLMNTGSRARLALALFGVLLLAACSVEQPRIPFDSLDFDLADAGSGQKLYNQSNNEAPACSACHSLDGRAAESAIRSTAWQMSRRRASRDSPRRNTSTGASCARVGTWSRGFSNIMYADYEEGLEAADIADLIAYLLTLE